jgi:hypothetical protein
MSTPNKISLTLSNYNLIDHIYIRLLKTKIYIKDQKKEWLGHHPLAGQEVFG